MTGNITIVAISHTIRCGITRLLLIESTRHRFRVADVKTETLDVNVAMTPNEKSPETSC